MPQSGPAHRPLVCPDGAAPGRLSPQGPSQRLRARWTEGPRPPGSRILCGQTSFLCSAGTQAISTRKGRYCQKSPPHGFVYVLQSPHTSTVPFPGARRTRQGASPPGDHTPASSAGGGDSPKGPGQRRTQGCWRPNQGQTEDQKGLSASTQATSLIKCLLALVAHSTVSVSVLRGHVLHDVWGMKGGRQRPAGHTGRSQSKVAGNEALDSEKVRQTLNPSPHPTPHPTHHQT